MTTQEERERALALEYCIAAAMEHQGNEEGPYTPESIRRREILRDCIPVPREEYDRLRRALWLILDHHVFGVPLAMSELLVDAGLLDCVENTDDETGVAYKQYSETPAAHEFAREMQEKAP